MGTSVVVVGGGASGLAAAVTAARSGAKVTLFEAGPGLGRKVLASGGGRCNLGNALLDPAKYHGGDRKFAAKVLSRFGNRESRAFFESLGLMVVEEADGRVFPRSGQSRSVLAVLEAGLNRTGARVEKGCLVTAVRPRAGGFVVEASGGVSAAADRVILACGGPAYPKLGGSAKGFDLASSLGLSIVPSSPCLVPLESPDAWVRKLSGIRVEAALTAHAGGKHIASSAGELLFTAYGVSGPAALDLSREVCRALSKAGEVECWVDLFPELGKGELERLLKARLKSLAPLSPAGLLRGMVAEAVAEVFLAGFKEEIPLHASPKEEAVPRLARGLNRWAFTVGGHRAWDEAMVSAGGVRLAEVSPDTMEAPNRRGLHVTGEMLDVDGDSGGYNLHFAWATGVIAGEACARPDRGT